MSSRKGIRACATLTYPSDRRYFHLSTIVIDVHSVWIATLFGRSGRKVDLVQSRRYDKHECDLNNTFDTQD